MDQFLSACLPGPPYKTENEPHFNTLVYFTMFPCHVLSCHYERFDNLNMMYIYLTIIGHTIHFSVRSIGASCWSCPSCLATFPPLRTCFFVGYITQEKELSLWEVTLLDYLNSFECVHWRNEVCLIATTGALWFLTVASTAK